MLHMDVIMGDEVIMTLNGVSNAWPDVYVADVLLIFLMEGDIEMWAVDPSITDEQAVAEVKRYFHESFGWDMEIPQFKFHPKFYLRRRP